MLCHAEIAFHGTDKDSDGQPLTSSLKAERSWAECLRRLLAVRNSQLWVFLGASAEEGICGMDYAGR